MAASVVALVSTVGLLILADFEHCRTTRPSAIIQSFLLLTILLDLPRVRTSWLLDGGSVVAAVFTATFAIRIVLLTLESIPKWKRVVAGPEIPPEERQGIFGRIFFWWLMPMFREGYRRDLSMDDLFAIDDDLKGDTLSARLLKSWESGASNFVIPYIADDIRADEVELLSSEPQETALLNCCCPLDFPPRTQPSPSASSRLFGLQSCPTVPHPCYDYLHYAT